MLTTAAYLETQGQPLRLSSAVLVPDLRPGQVLVELAFSGVCHSQLMEAQGRRGPDRYLPHMLGHEGSGRVVAVGSAVRKVQPGDLVVLGWIKGEGCEEAGARYRVGEDLWINAGGVTTFQRHAVVSENRCTPIPAGIPLDVAALFGCALPTGAGMVLNTVDPRPGSTLAVWGLGGIGLSALMAALATDCAQVIAIDVEATKLDLAAALGAHACIDASACDPLAALAALTGGGGLDYCVEAAGRADTIEQAFRAVRRGGGLCVFASHPAHGETIALDPFELICGKRILGSWGGDCRPDRDIPRFGELYRRGRWPLERLISAVYPLEGINEAMEALASRRVTRALLAINPAMEGVCP